MLPHNEPMFKWKGHYITIPELVKKLDSVELKYCHSNNSIQVRDKLGKFIGCIKYDWTGEIPCR